MEIKRLSAQKVFGQFPKRKRESHKGDYGRILMLCGSRGYTGAAALAAMGALRVGAGLVFLGVPESIYPIEAVKLTEPVVFPLPDAKGMYAETAIPQVLERTERMDAIAIGSGMGQGKGCEALLMALMEQFHGPIILDADGINLISRHIDILRGRQAPTILTPHSGEYARLSADESPEGVTALAEDLGCIILRKGHRTVISDGTSCFENMTGNPGMAVGGSGDVLTGIIAGLLGQGFSPLEAAACGAWLHGAAGDRCAESLGEYGMLPTDMLDVLPRLIRQGVME